MIRITVFLVGIFVLLLSVQQVRAMGVKACGLTLQALNAKDLDAIEAQLGKRAGVMIAAVTPDSPAAKAGCVKGEIVCSVNGQFVDSPQAVEKALAGKADAIELVGFLLAENGAKVVKRTLTLDGIRTPPEKITPAGEKDADTQKKLQALEAAHKAGILTDDEFAKKKADLLKNNKPAPADNTKYIASRKGKTYQHVIGFSFWYPEGWSVKEENSAFKLIPENPAMAEGKPAEMYFITGQPLEGTGITDIRHPQVVAYLDQLIAKQVSPLLQRKKEPAPVQMSNGNGLLLEWEVQGKVGIVHARAYACILKDYGVVLFGFGVKEKVLARDADLKTIFASFGFEAGKQDPALVGAWKLFSTRTIRNEDNVNFTTDDPRRASAVTDEQLTLQLRPDGTVTRTSISRTIAGGGAIGGGNTVWIDSGDQKSVKQGRWNAGNGILFVMWQDGAMDSWRYNLQNGAKGETLGLQEGSQLGYWVRK